MGIPRSFAKLSEYFNKLTLDPTTVSGPSVVLWLIPYLNPLVEAGSRFPWTDSISSPLDNTNRKKGFSTLRLRQYGHRFPDDTFKYIFLNENVWISLQISLKFIPKVWINNIPALVQIMAWRRLGDKPLSEPMMGNSLTHICVTRPQWVNINMLYQRTSNTYQYWQNLTSPLLVQVSKQPIFITLKESVSWNGLKRNWQ